MATAEHPFWREGRGWVGAGELVPGQRVLRADGRWLRVEGVEVRGGAQTVYNLEVEDFHTYVVGQLGAWVHNECKVGWLGKASNRVGKEAESKLKELLGPGAAKKTFPTPFGKRKADSVLEDVIHEAKAGYATMSKRIKGQIAKDSWLKDTRNVKDVEWHFFRSSKSGEVGPSGPLREALEEAGFKIHEHLLRAKMAAKVSNEYFLVQPPFDRNPRDMVPKERKAYYAWFLSVIPGRLEQLSGVVKQTAGFEAWQPDFTPQSLDALGRWFADQVETRLRTPEEMAELRAQIQAALPGVEPPERTLTHRTVSLSLDVGIYLGQVLISTVGGIRWQQASGGKTLVDFGQPVLTGLPLGDCNPIRLALVFASAIADGSRDGAGLRELYNIWTGKAPIRLPRFKQR